MDQEPGIGPDHPEPTRRSSRPGRRPGRRTWVAVVGGAVIVAVVAAATAVLAIGPADPEVPAAQVAAGHDHATTVAATPCEESGPGIDGEGSGHGHRGPATEQTLDATTRSVLTGQLTTAREAAARYPTAADAMAAGYRKITNYLPCIAAHYINPRFVDFGFDASAPEMLLYGGDGPDAPIVGLSYFVLGLVAPQGFAGPNDEWHQHFGLCISIAERLVIGGSTMTTEECQARGGMKADGSFAWMVHAWVVPGWESTWGTFSAEHPELGTRAPA